MFQTKAFSTFNESLFTGRFTGLRIVKLYLKPDLGISLGVINIPF